MAPTLSPSTYTHTEAERTAKELIARAFKAKKATQQIPHFENALPGAANFIKCTLKSH